MSREIDSLRERVDLLRGAAAPALKNGLARKLVEEAIRYTFAISGQALSEFQQAMQDFDNGLLPASSSLEYQAGLLRQQISAQCSWSEDSSSLIQCVNVELMKHQVKTVRQPDVPQFRPQGS